MTQVRFGGGENPWGYQAARNTYQLPQKAEAWLKPKVGGAVAGFVKNQLTSDFSSFTNVSVGKFKTLLAEPPKLPLLLLLYPGTVGPRLYRAYQRGKENNDYREMGDVLRRDVTAITLFVFALSPVVNGISRFVQQVKGVNLVKDGGGVLSYSDFRNYEIDTPKALWQLVKEGNGNGLKNAINALKDDGLTEKYHALNPAKKADYANTLKTLKREVAQFVDEFSPEKYKLPEKGTPAEKQLAEKLPIDKAKTVYKSFDQAQQDIVDILEHCAKNGCENGSREVLEIAKNLQGQAKGALKHFAKVHRLPADMVSFALMIGAIGWAPMAFNGWWNKRQYDKQQAAAISSATTPAVAPSMPFQRSFQPVNGFQPLTGFSAQSPAINPFNRSAF
ncbi:hypothetical protein [Vampirovibrio sp.]|uniref:hypothetical protein n=1 Tax=Vampirovibrio sp. TaxID=2717857 RepID=UPI003592F2B1